MGRSRLGRTAKEKGDKMKSLRSAIEAERDWYLKAFQAAEKELLKIAPRHAALGLVQCRIKALLEDVASRNGCK